MAWIVLENQLINLDNVKSIEKRGENKVMLFYTFMSDDVVAHEEFTFNHHGAVDCIFETIRSIVKAKPVPPDGM